MLQALPKHSIGAELGVFSGDFSEQILRIVRPRLLYLVDLFSGPAVSGDENGHMRWENMLEMPGRLSERFRGSPVEIVKMSSTDWLISLPPHSLDWVYIDTDHEYSNTAKELSASLRAVKIGGFIAGHDYAPQTPGVIRAVDELLFGNAPAGTLYAGDSVPSFLIVNSGLDKDSKRA